MTILYKHNYSNTYLLKVSQKDVDDENYNYFFKSD